MKEQIKQQKEFHYRDQVEVTEGFYKGAKGTVISQIKDIFTHEYRVRIGDIDRIFQLSQLKLIKRGRTESK